jgi:hypothetical protein
MESGTTSSALDKLDQTNSIGCLIGSGEVTLEEVDVGDGGRVRGSFDVQDLDDN